MGLLIISSLFGASRAEPRSQSHSSARDQYIVQFADELVASRVPDLAREVAAQHGLTLRHIYSHALKGFSATIPLTKLSQLRSDPRIKLIEPDQIARAFADLRNSRNYARSSARGPSGPIAPTGIRRIKADLNRANTGKGVAVAVLDTGIMLNHRDLKDNIAGAIDFTGENNTGDDNNDRINGAPVRGHGTHVAGVIAGRGEVMGVGPEIKLYSVKVLGWNGAGFISDIIAGIDFITERAGQIAIANLSFGLPSNRRSSALRAAIQNSIRAGIIYVAAAGNDHQPCSAVAPACFDEVITVSAFADDDGTPDMDRFASFSNYGMEIDIAAPGVDILSTSNDGASSLLSGTSLAASHVSGTVALWIAKNGRPNRASADSPEMQRIIKDISTAAEQLPGDPDSFAEPLLCANKAALQMTAH